MPWRLPYTRAARGRRGGGWLELGKKVDAATAAAMRFDLDNEGDRKALAKLQKKWQADTWYYVDTVGELKYAERFIRNSFRRVRVFAAFMRSEEGDPIPVLDSVKPANTGEADAELPVGVEVSDLDERDFLPEEVAQAAYDIIAGFAARDGGQAALMERAGGNLFLVGDLLLVRRAVHERRAQEIEDPEAPDGKRMERPDEVPRVMDWEVRSIDEVIEDQARRKMVVRDGPDDDPSKCPVVEGVTGEAAFVERVWRKHGRWSRWSDSNVRAAMGVLDELDLLAKLARVSIRMRILAGILTMPDEMDFPNESQPPGDDQPRRSVKFDRNYAEAVAAAIGNETDANTVAPLLLRGPKDLLGQDAVRLIEIPRRYGEQERAQYEDAVTRLARTLDLPVEVVKGMADLNHWTAWQIEDSTYEAHIEPHVSVMTEGLLYALLRPALLEQFPAPEMRPYIDRIVVAADPSQLIRRPDRGKTATEGYGLMALSWDAWRRANGFGDDDAPSHDEMVMRLALQRSILTAELSALLLEQSELLPEGTFAAITAAKAPAAAPTDDEPVAPEDEEEREPGGGEAEPTDEEAVAAAGPLAALLGRDAHDVAAVVAAARRMGTGQSLALADRVLRERLQASVDAASSRALDRAGTRLRNKTRGNDTARDAIAAAGGQAVAHRDVGRVLGAAVVAALASEEELFEGAVEEMRADFDEWVSAVQASALGAIAAVAGDKFTDELRHEVEREQEEDREEAWEVLAAALLAFLAKRFVGAEDQVEEGEFDPTAVVPANIVREALAVAGGDVVEHGFDGALLNAAEEPVGGVATGRLVRLTFGNLGFPWTGYTWLYGMAPRKTNFEPHLALDGVTFESWTSDVLNNMSGWPRVAHYFPGDHLYCRCDFAPAIGTAVAASA